MEFVDRELKCVSCGAAFVFRAAEQAFFKTRGLLHDPKRCRACRANSKGKTPDTEVTCAECGKQTTVPFHPRGGRPVFCRECFVKQREAAKASAGEVAPEAKS